MTNRRLRQMLGLTALLVVAAVLVVGGCRAEPAHRGASDGGIEPVGGGILLAEEQVQIVLKRERAAAYNLNPSDVEAAVISYVDRHRGNLSREGLLAMQVGTFNGQAVFLGDVAELRTTPATRNSPPSQ